eukprot:g332.t1
MSVPHDISDLMQALASKGIYRDLSFDHEKLLATEKDEQKKTQLDIVKRIVKNAKQSSLQQNSERFEEARECLLKVRQDLIQLHTPVASAGQSPIAGDDPRSSKMDKILEAIEKVRDAVDDSRGALGIDPRLGGVLGGDLGLDEDDQQADAENDRGNTLRQRWEQNRDDHARSDQDISNYLEENGLQEQDQQETDEDPLKGSTSTARRPKEFTDWHRGSPETIANPSHTNEDLIDHAKAKPKCATDSLNIIFQESIVSNIRILSKDGKGTHPIPQLIRHDLQKDLKARPGFFARETRADSTEAAINFIQSCSICVRWASAKGQLKVMDERGDAHGFMKMVGGYGHDFIRLTRQLVIFMHMYCRKKDDKWRRHPLVRVAFSTQFQIVKIRIYQLALVWIRCSVIIDMPADHPNYNTIIRRICEEDPMRRHARPCLEHFYEDTPMPIEKAKELANADPTWAWQNDDFEEEVTKFANLCSGYNPIADSMQTFPHRYPPEHPLSKAKGNLEVAQKKLYDQNEKKDEEEDKLAETIDDVIDLTQGQNTEEERVVGEKSSSSKAPRKSTTQKNEQNKGKQQEDDSKKKIAKLQAQEDAKLKKKQEKEIAKIRKELQKKDKTPKSSSSKKSKQVHFDDEEAIDPRNVHSSVLGAAGKGFEPLAGHQNAKGPIERVTASGTRIRVPSGMGLNDMLLSLGEGGGEVRSSFQHHGLRASRAFNEMQIQGGLISTGTSAAGGGPNYFSNGGAASSSYAAAASQPGGGAADLLTRQDDGGKDFVRSAFDIRSTYASARMAVKEEDLEADPFAKLDLDKKTKPKQELPKNAISR